MRIVIEIPNKDIPKHQEIIDIYLDFIDGHIVNAGGYGFEELPKGHGRLIDERQVVMALTYHDFLKDNVKCGDITKILDMATIIEADKE